MKEGCALHPAKKKNIKESPTAGNSGMKRKSAACRKEVTHILGENKNGAGKFMRMMRVK